MDPISNNFAYDFQRFVLQNPQAIPPIPHGFPKPFSVKPTDKVDKAKKDMKREKDQKNEDKP